MTLKELEQSLRIIRWIAGQMKFQWFVCFGTLLGLIRDGAPIHKDSDIDVGMLYEDMNEKLIISGMLKNSYKCNGTTRNDYDPRQKSFHLSFKHATLPDICVFAWYKHGNIRYHTFDTLIEKKPIPSEYVFRGVPDACFHQFREYWPRGPKKELLTQHGFQLPLKYGTLLDYWYPDWKIPRKGHSRSPYAVRMKSCKKWEDKKYVEESLKKSRIEYDQYVKIL